MDGHDLLKQIGVEYDKQDNAWYGVAKTTFSAYDNLKKVGFSDRQAFELTKAMFIETMKKG